MFAKKMAALLLACLMLVSVVGCSKTEKISSGANTASGKTLGSYNDEKATVTFWHTYSSTNEAVVFDEQVLTKLKTKYPNITVKSSIQPTDNLSQNLLTAVATSSGPDVMRMDVSWVPQFANLNSLVELTNYIGFDTVKTDAYPGCLATCAINGKYYGLPLDTNTKCAIYNNAALKAAGLSAAPTTFDQLFTAAKTITSTHKGGLIAVSGTSAWSCAPYFLSLGGTYCSKDYKVASGYVNSQASITALQKLVDLYDQGVIAPNVIGKGTGTWEGIKKDDGGLMMIDDGPWFFTSLSDADKSKVTMATIPSGAGGSISLVGGEDIVMFKSCSAKAAAWQFMQFMVSKETQKTLALKANQMTPFKSIASDSEISANEVFKTYSKQLETAWARIPNAKWNEIDDAINKTFEAAFRKTDTVTNLLNKLASTMDGYLKAGSGD